MLDRVHTTSLKPASSHEGQQKDEQERYPEQPHVVARWDSVCDLLAKDHESWSGEEELLIGHHDRALWLLSSRPGRCA